jgi:hypothetical protein
MIGLRITEDCHPLREVGETQGELLDGSVMFSYSARRVWAVDLHTQSSPMWNVLMASQAS